MLAAAIEVERGAPEPARQLLSQVQVDGLDEWRLALWARLMETTGRRATASQALRDLGVEPQPVAVPPTAVPSPRIMRRFKTVPDKKNPRRTARQKAPTVPAQQQPAPVVQPRSPFGGG